MNTPFAASLDESSTSALPLAAIVHTHGDPADELLASFAFSLRAQGLQVRGLIQHSSAPGKDKVMLIDLDSGQYWPLFQALGSRSQSCSLDTASLAAASVSLRRALDAAADLVVANRFGTMEAEGRGLADELLALMCAGQPLLTVVADKHLTAWRDFSGGYGIELPPERAALERWFSSLPAQRSGGIQSAIAQVS
ncbi:MAG: DUF2478 domain-containing protein [Thauera sp.]|jgi:nucleoside-triphosphatase THEP1|nr:DUF2478 domain-containing protein [Thauera sp.]